MKKELQFSIERTISLDKINANCKRIAKAMAKVRIHEIVHRYLQFSCSVQRKNSHISFLFTQLKFQFYLQLCSHEYL